MSDTNLSLKNSRNVTDNSGRKLGINDQLIYDNSRKGIRTCILDIVLPSYAFLSYHLSLPFQHSSWFPCPPIDWICEMKCRGGLNRHHQPFYCKKHGNEIKGNQKVSDLGFPVNFNNSYKQDGQFKLKLTQTCLNRLTERISVILKIIRVQGDHINKWLPF